MKNRFIVSMVMMLAILAIASCTKTEVKYEDGRPTIVKTPEANAEINVIARDVLPTIEEFDLLTIDRSVTRPEDLNSPLTVKVALSPTLITDYNSAHGTSYVALPATAYTLSDDLNNIVLAAGEATKKIKIRVDKAQLDLSKQYALGFSITEVGSGAKLSVLKDALFSIGVKNKYDGVYSYVSGLVTRYTSPGVPANDALSGPLGPANPDVELITSGANTVRIAGLTWSGGTSGVGGIDPVSATVNPATNAVTMASGTNASLANWAGKPNNYDPTGKTFTLNFAWNPTTTPREYSVVLKYKGPR